MKKQKKELGITLIVLVITIIVLIILVGISIFAINADNGLFKGAKRAKELTEKAEIEENEKINGFTLSMSEIENVSDRGENSLDSKKFTTAELNITEIAEKTFKTNITTDAEDPSCILGYVIFLEKESNSEKKGYMTKDSIYKIEGLEVNTKYKVYAYVCDLDGGLRKTNTVEVTTLEGPLITIDSIYYLDIISTGSTNDVTLARNCLFDGNTNNGGGYKGVLFNTKSNMVITVNAKSKIYAYGHYYSDGGGNSGKNVIFSKYNGSSYVAYKTVSTNYSGNKYELTTLEPGKYMMTIDRNYVSFDEFIAEKIN